MTDAWYGPCRRQGWAHMEDGNVLDLGVEPSAQRRCDCESLDCHPKGDCEQFGTVRTIYSTVCRHCANGLPGEYLVEVYQSAPIECANDALVATAFGCTPDNPCWFCALRTTADDEANVPPHTAPTAEPMIAVERVRNIAKMARAIQRQADNIARLSDNDTHYKGLWQGQTIAARIIADALDSLLDSVTK